MTTLGTIKRGTELGRKDKGKWRWDACHECGKERWVQLRNGKPKSICCAHCGNKKRRGKHPSPNTEFKKGQKAWNYKGWTKSYGYIMRRVPNHPKASKNGLVAEHLLVWEEYHKQSLPVGYVVHHINGIKEDNRPKNLLAVPRKGHSPSMTIKEVQKRLREVEAELSQQRLF